MNEKYILALILNGQVLPVEDATFTLDDKVRLTSQWKKAVPGTVMKVIESEDGELLVRVADLQGMVWGKTS